MYIQIRTAFGDYIMYEGEDVTYEIEGSNFIVYPEKITKIAYNLEGKAYTTVIPDPSKQHIYVNPSSVSITKGE